jgi:hypothetical protein
MLFGKRSGLFVFGLLGQSHEIVQAATLQTTVSEAFRMKLKTQNFRTKKKRIGLSKFVVELRNENGEFYTPNSLMQIACGLQRHLRENGYADLNLFTDALYKSFCDSLDSQMKELSSEGIGVHVKKSEPFSYDEEEMLRQKGALGTDEPEKLLNTLLFLIGKCFYIRGGEEHRALQPSQFTVIPATNRKEKSSNLQVLLIRHIKVV